MIMLSLLGYKRKIMEEKFDAQTNTASEATSQSCPVSKQIMMPGGRNNMAEHAKIKGEDVTGEHVGCAQGSHDIGSHYLDSLSPFWILI